jgi:hypothetical protein
MSNAAPEWQAKLKCSSRERVVAGPLKGHVIRPIVKFQLPTSDSSNLAPLVTHLVLADSYIGSAGKAMTLFAPNNCVSFIIAFVLRICVNNIASRTLGREQAT